MEIIIQSPGFKASETLQNFVNEKLGKLDHLKDGIIRADVTLFLDAHGNADNKHCEARLEIPGNDLFVKKHADSFEKAVAESVDALQMMLRKSKEKDLDKRHG